MVVIENVLFMTAVRAVLLDETLDEGVVLTESILLVQRRGIVLLMDALEVLLLIEIVKSALLDKTEALALPDIAAAVVLSETNTVVCVDSWVTALSRGALEAVVLIVIEGVVAVLPF